MMIACDPFPVLRSTGLRLGPFGAPFPVLRSTGLRLGPFGASFPALRSTGLRLDTLRFLFQLYEVLALVFGDPLKLHFQLYEVLVCDRDTLELHFQFYEVLVCAWDIFVVIGFASQYTCVVTFALERYRRFVESDSIQFS